MGSDVHCHFQFPVNTIFTISTLAMLGIFLVPGISPVQCQSLNGFVMASLVGVAAADDDEPTADGCCSGGEAGGGDGGSGSHVCVVCDAASWTRKHQYSKQLSLFGVASR